MDKIYLVASTLADIGKGWLTASIADLVGGYPIKIDPALNAVYIPKGVGSIDASLVSTDASTYRQLELDIEPEYVIRGGDIVYSFLKHTRKPIDKFNPHTEKRMTFADVSNFLEKRLEVLSNPKGSSTPVIEMGGSVYDDNLQYLADGVRGFANHNDASFNIILLSYLTSSDDENHAIKVNDVVNGVKRAADVYRREPSYVFVRNRSKNPKLSADKIIDCIDKIAYRTQILPEKILFEPEFENATQLRDYIGTLDLFKPTFHTATEVTLQIEVDNTLLKIQTKTYK